MRRLSVILALVCAGCAVQHPAPSTAKSHVDVEIVKRELYALIPPFAEPPHPPQSETFSAETLVGEWECVSECMTVSKVGAQKPSRPNHYSARTSCTFEKGGHYIWRTFMLGGSMGKSREAIREGTWSFENGILTVAGGIGLRDERTWSNALKWYGENDFSLQRQDLEGQRAYLDSMSNNPHRLWHDDKGRLCMLTEIGKLNQIVLTVDGAKFFRRKTDTVPRGGSASDGEQTRIRQLYESGILSEEEYRHEIDNRKNGGM